MQGSCTTQLKFTLIKIIYPIDELQYIMFVDDTSRAFTDIQIEFPNRSTARKYFKVVKEGLGIKKGFK